MSLVMVELSLFLRIKLWLLLWLWLEELNEPPLSLTKFLLPIRFNAPLSLSPPLLPPPLITPPMLLPLPDLLPPLLLPPLRPLPVVSVSKVSSFPCSTYISRLPSYNTTISVRTINTRLLVIRFIGFIVVDIDVVVVIVDNEEERDEEEVGEGSARSLVSCTLFACTFTRRGEGWWGSS